MRLILQTTCRFCCSLQQVSIPFLTGLKPKYSKQKSYTILQVMATKPTGLMMVYILKSSSHGELMLMLIINLLTFHISRYVCCVVSVGTISRQSVGHIVDGKNPARVNMSNIHQKTSTNQRLNRFSCCYIVSIPASSITSSFTESLITPKHDMQQHPY